MAEHKLDDFIELDVDTFDLDELLNYEPPQVQPVRNNQWINNSNNQEDVIGDTTDPMEDPFIQGLFEDASQPSVKIRNLCESESFPISEGGELGFGSVPSAPVLCSFCLVLREIVHTNGYYSTKLEIHGRVGVICHAVLLTQNCSSGNQTHQMLNLSNKSTECVRDILIQYCESRKQAGFVLVDDPMAPFYEALCVGLDLSDSYDNSDGELDPPPLLAGPTDNDNRLDVVVANQASISVQRTRYQKQREKAANLTVEEVAGYFHLTLTKAAKELGLCATVVKRFCRRHGMPRWPYRKIKGYETKISDMRDALQRTFDVDQKKRVEAEIAWLRRKVRRGEDILKLRACVVPDPKHGKLSKKCTVCALSDDRHVAVLGNLSANRCLELQEISRRTVNEEGRGLKTKGVISEMKMSDYLPDSHALS